MEGLERLEEGIILLPHFHFSVASNVAEVSAVQPDNALEPIEVTVAGMTISARAVQPLNAYVSISATPDIVIDTSEVQP